MEKGYLAAGARPSADRGTPIHPRAGPSRRQVAPLIGDHHEHHHPHAHPRVAAIGLAGVVALAGAVPLPTAPAPPVTASTGASPANYQGTWALTSDITNNSGQDPPLHSATNDTATDRPELHPPERRRRPVRRHRHLQPIWNITRTNVTDENEVGFTASITDLDHAVATIDITNPNA